jgi:hypothetical protein
VVNAVSCVEWGVSIFYERKILWSFKLFIYLSLSWSSLPFYPTKIADSGPTLRSFRFHAADKSTREPHENTLKKCSKDLLTFTLIHDTQF